MNQPTARVNQPTAGVNQPTPSAEAQTPTPTPGVNQPTPSVNQPTPAVNQPTPGINQPTPGINQPTPSISQPTLQVNQPTEVVNQPIPGAGQQTPKVTKEEALQETTGKDTDLGQTPAGTPESMTDKEENTIAEVLTSLASNIMTTISSTLFTTTQRPNQDPTIPGKILTTKGKQSIETLEKSSTHAPSDTTKVLTHDRDYMLNLLEKLKENELELAKVVGQLQDLKNNPELADVDLPIVEDLETLSAGELEEQAHKLINATFSEVDEIKQWLPADSTKEPGLGSTESTTAYDKEHMQDILNDVKGNDEDLEEFVKQLQDLENSPELAGVDLPTVEDLENLSPEELEEQANKLIDAAFEEVDEVSEWPPPEAPEEPEVYDKEFLQDMLNDVKGDEEDLAEFVKQLQDLENSPELVGVDLPTVEDLENLSPEELEEQANKLIDAAFEEVDEVSEWPPTRSI